VFKGFRGFRGGGLKGLKSLEMGFRWILMELWHLWAI
jgi:hypothetical protein